MSSLPEVLYNKNFDNIRTYKLTDDGAVEGCLLCQERTIEYLIVHYNINFDLHVLHDPLSSVLKA